MDTRYKVLIKARKANKECDWWSYKRLRNLSNKKVKQAKQKYQKDLLFEDRNKPIKFCNCIKEMFPSKESVTIYVTTSIRSVRKSKKTNSIYTKLKI